MCDELKEVLEKIEKMRRFISYVGDEARIIADWLNLNGSRDTAEHLENISLAAKDALE